MNLKNHNMETEPCKKVYSFFSLAVLSSNIKIPKAILSLRLAKAAKPGIFKLIGEKEENYPLFLLR